MPPKMSVAGWPSSAADETQRIVVDGESPFRPRDAHTARQTETQGEEEGESPMQYGIGMSEEDQPEHSESLTAAAAPLPSSGVVRAVSHKRLASILAAQPFPTLRQDPLEITADGETESDGEIIIGSSHHNNNSNDNNAAGTESNTDSTATYSAASTPMRLHSSPKQEQQSGEYRQEERHGGGDQQVKGTRLVAAQGGTKQDRYRQESTLSTTGDVLLTDDDDEATVDADDEWRRGGQKKAAEETISKNNSPKHPQAPGSANAQGQHLAEHATPPRQSNRKGTRDDKVGSRPSLPHARHQLLIGEFAEENEEPTGSGSSGHPVRAGGDSSNAHTGDSPRERKTRTNHRSCSNLSESSTPVLMVTPHIHSPGHTTSRQARLQNEQCPEEETRGKMLVSPMYGGGGGPSEYAQTLGVDELSLRSGTASQWTTAGGGATNTAGYSQQLLMSAGKPQKPQVSPDGTSPLAHSNNGERNTAATESLPETMDDGCFKPSFSPAKAALLLTSKSQQRSPPAPQDSLGQAILLGMEEDVALPSACTPPRHKQRPPTRAEAAVAAAACVDSLNAAETLKAMTATPLQVPKGSGALVVGKPLPFSLKPAPLPVIGLLGTGASNAAQPKEVEGDKDDSDEGDGTAETEQTEGVRRLQTSSACKHAEATATKKVINKKSKKTTSVATKASLGHAVASKTKNFTEPHVPFQVGDAVEAKWGRRWFAATVAEDEKNGYAQIQWMEDKSLIHLRIREVRHKKSSAGAIEQNGHVAEAIAPLVNAEGVHILQQQVREATHPSVPELAVATAVMKQTKREKRGEQDVRSSLEPMTATQLAEMMREEDEREEQQHKTCQTIPQRDRAGRSDVRRKRQRDGGREEEEEADPFNPARKWNAIGAQHKAEQQDSHCEVAIEDDAVEVDTERVCIYCPSSIASDAIAKDRLACLSALGVTVVVDSLAELEERYLATTPHHSEAKARKPCLFLFVCSSEGAVAGVEDADAAFTRTRSGSRDIHVARAMGLSPLKPSWLTSQESALSNLERRQLRLPDKNFWISAVHTGSLSLTVPLHCVPLRNEDQRCFSGKRILFTSKDSDMSRLLCAAGAEVVVMPSLGSRRVAVEASSYDYVYMPPGRRASLTGEVALLPLLEVTWVLTSIDKHFASTNATATADRIRELTAPQGKKARTAAEKEEEQSFNLSGNRNSVAAKPSLNNSEKVDEGDMDDQQRPAPTQMMTSSDGTPPVTGAMRSGERGGDKESPCVREPDMHPPINSISPLSAQGSTVALAYLESHHQQQQQRQQQQQQQHHYRTASRFDSASSSGVVFSVCEGEDYYFRLSVPYHSVSAFMGLSASIALGRVERVIHNDVAENEQREPDADRHHHHDHHLPPQQSYGAEGGGGPSLYVTLRLYETKYVDMYQNPRTGEVEHQTTVYLSSNVVTVPRYALLFNTPVYVVDASAKRHVYVLDDSTSVGGKARGTASRPTHEGEGVCNDDVDGAEDGHSSLESRYCVPETGLEQRHSDRAGRPTLPMQTDQGESVAAGAVTMEESTADKHVCVDRDRYDDVETTGSPTLFHTPRYVPHGEGASRLPQSVPSEEDSQEEHLQRVRMLYALRPSLLRRAGSSTAALEQSPSVLEEIEVWSHRVRQGTAVRFRNYLPASSHSKTHNEGDVSHAVTELTTPLQEGRVSMIRVVNDNAVVLFVHTTAPNSVFGGSKLQVIVPDMIVEVLPNED